MGQQSGHAHHNSNQQCSYGFVRLLLYNHNEFTFILLEKGNRILPERANCLIVPLNKVKSLSYHTFVVSIYPCNRDFQCYVQYNYASICVHVHLPLHRCCFFSSQNKWRLHKALHISTVIHMPWLGLYWPVFATLTKLCRNVKS